MEPRQTKPPAPPPAKQTQSDAGVSAVMMDMSAQIETAKRWPRDPKRFLETATAMVQMSERVAAECHYVIPRGGDLIVGPSIALAELLASCWGNLRIASRVTGETGTHVVAQGIVIDLETNVVVQAESRRRITTRTGSRYNDDMIIMTMNAACSIARRNAILQVVPKPFVYAVSEAARKKCVGDPATFAQRRDQAIALFETNLGVTPDMLAKHLGCRPEDMEPEQFVNLHGLYQAITDGMVSVQAVFGAAPAAKGAPAAPPTGRTKISGRRRPSPTPDAEPGPAQAPSAPQPPPAAPDLAPAPDETVPEDEI